jgi:hypothetical protein
MASLSLDNRLPGYSGAIVPSARGSTANAKSGWSLTAVANAATQLTTWAKPAPTQRPDPSLPQSYPTDGLRAGTTGVAGAHSSFDDCLRLVANIHAFAEYLPPEVVQTYAPALRDVQGIVASATAEREQNVRELGTKKMEEQFNAHFADFKHLLHLEYLQVRVRSSRFPLIDVFH